MFRCGSHVYGTSSNTSDQDFVIVWKDPDAKKDLLFRPKLNFVVYGLTAFGKALEDQNVFALECYFAPKQHVLKEASFHFKLDSKKLFEAAKERSDSDYAKAKRIFDHDPESAKKKVFHAIRVPQFAKQIAEFGKIVNFHAAIPTWEEIILFDGVEWTEWDLKFGPLRTELLRSY